MSTMFRLTTILTILILSTLSSSARERTGRPKPSEKAKAERQKDLFWFKVSEEEKSKCNDVSESELEDSIIAGAPGDTCQTDQERFCFCGKKGKSPTTNWKFICGTCIKNKPFSFKIERPEKKKLGSRPETDG